MTINFDLLKPSASMEVTRLAGMLKKQGRKVFPLSAGDTHFPPPKVLTDTWAQLPSAYSHYTDAEGIEPLRKQIAEQYTGYSAQDVILVPGLKQGIYYTLAALELKTMCMLEPAWLGYESSAVLAGYNTVSVNLHQPDWTRQLLDTTFDLIIVCSPNNPDGKVFSIKETEAIIQAAHKNKAWILTDFIYDRYVYEGNMQSVVDLLMKYPKLIYGNGFSKSHAMTGFRTGYLLIKDEPIKQRILTIQQNLATCVPAISQYMLLQANQAETEIKNNSEYYRQNKELIVSIFPEWAPFKPSGGFYYFIDLTPYGITDAHTFCKMVLQEDGIALVPGPAYGNGFDSYIRLSFSIDRDVLHEALILLKKRLNK